LNSTPTAPKRHSPLLRGRKYLDNKAEAVTGTRLNPSQSDNRIPFEIDVVRLRVVEGVVEATGLFS
jgi:hypothetical protein